MKVDIRCLGGLKFEVNAREHTFICDQPNPKGDNQGPTPTELFISSLGTCAGVYVASYCQTRGMDPSQIRIEVVGEKALQPTRIGSIKMIVHVPFPISDKDRQGLMRAMDGCLVKNTLLTPPTLSIELEAASSEKPED